MLRTAAVILSLAAPALADQSIHEVPIGDGKTTIRYTLTTPDGADLKKPLPVVIVFPPGPQTSQMEGAARGMFAGECMQRGWALVTPQPPEGTLFHAKPSLYRALIDDLDKTVVAEGGRYHAAGASNGGASAVGAAVALPGRIASVAGFPGAVVDPPPEPELATRLKGVPVRLWVGSDDTVVWNDRGRALETFGKRFKDQGVDVTLTVVPGQGHVIRTLTAGAVLDELDTHRSGKGTMGRTELDAAATLDALHAAAARADLDGYFSLFAPGAVFVGTDAAERWTLAEFRAYAQPVFQKTTGKAGWTYTLRPGARHITVLPGEGGKAGTVAYFEELLDSESYGTTRGTGVLTLISTGEGDAARRDWKVAQYSLSIPIPNALAKRVAAMVKTEEGKKK